MMQFSEGEKNTTGGCGLLGTVLIVFLILKLGGIVDWSWWIILAPLWGTLAVIVVAVVVAVATQGFRGRIRD